MEGLLSPVSPDGDDVASFHFSLLEVSILVCLFIFVTVRLT